MLHTRMLLSLAAETSYDSRQASVPTVFPSDDSSSRFTLSVCAVNSPTSSPESTFHTRMRASLPPVSSSPWEKP